MHEVGQFPVKGSAAPRSRLRIAVGRCAGVAVLALVALTAAAAPGEAQHGGTGPAAANDKHKASEVPRGPLLAVVSIARQRIQVYDRSGLVAQSPVSTGMLGYRTPTGVFAVLQKRRYHESNIYSGAPMPFMQRLTWSGVALHAGVLPGYPASHGCIRLPHNFAVELWGMTKVGTRVVVAPDDPAALPIEDARLPAPRLTPIPVGDDRLREEAGSMAHGPVLASAAGQSAVDADEELGPRGVPRLDPWQRAVAAKAVAAKDAVAKAKAAQLATQAAATKAAEARHALAVVRRAELAVAAAERRHELAARAVAAASQPTAAERDGPALAAAEDGLAEAQRDADEARLIAAALGEQAAEAAAAAVEAETERREAAAAVKAAERGVEPITILVSRKTGRVYIRQAWEPVHEAAARFVEAGPPLGTHVYLATGPAAGGAALRWLAVSLPASPPRPQRPRDRDSASVPAPSLPHEAAAGALARFELSEETQRFIADRLWAGATLIVSDHGISGETGLGTDFIVLTR